MSRFGSTASAAKSRASATRHLQHKAALEQAVGRIHATIEKQRVRRQSNRVLHGHPPPIFWPRQSVPIREVLAKRASAMAAMPKRLIFYVGTPYCIPTTPDKCGFCLFPSEHYQNAAQLDGYLGLLRQEARMYEEFFEHEQPDAVYFGGGTSNLYKPHQYEQLMGVVRSTFPRMSPSAEITLEGIPQLFSEDKLRAMKAAGVTRVSMGVQQLDDELIQFSGRKQKRQQTFAALEVCRELGLPASIDLIFGWPQQTVDHMLRDLEAIVSTGISHITHYELNVAGRTHFARHRRDELPSTEQNLEMYRIGRDFLKSHGYRQVTAYDWKKEDSAQAGDYRYEESWHSVFTSSNEGVTGLDAWGLGFAGTSNFLGTPQEPGWAFMNAVSMDEYARALSEGRFPIERGFQYTPADLRLQAIFHMLQAMEIDIEGYRRIFGMDMIEEFAPIWQALGECGWVELDGHKVRLVGDGVFYTPLIQNLLSEARMKEMRIGAAEGA